MSNYRDDTQETAIASSSTWMGLKTLTESLAKITATSIFTLGVIHAEQAVAADEVIDRKLHVVTESAAASGSVFDSAHAQILVSEKAKLSERFAHRIGVSHYDTASIADYVFESQGSMLADQAAINDEVIGSRTAYTLVTEQARVSDFSGQATADTVADHAQIAAEVSDQLQASELVSDTARVSDYAQGTGTASITPIVETATAQDEVIGTLIAADTVNDWMLIDARLLGDGSETGSAWTACVDNWAMSRYAPYTFDRLVVINGALYGEASDGVYALSGGNEIVDARVTTGRIDMSGGPHTRPVAAYLEYALSGSVEMDVTTTQSGSPATYTYGLPPEQADHLTNGRIQFGRGLVGRHFAFELRLSGRHGCINDLSIQTAQGRRRI